MIVSCEATPCPVILSATCVFYKGEDLIYTGINMNDNLQIALEKIDGKFKDTGLGYIFENGIIQLSPGEPVRLGGSLMQNTTINSGGFTFKLTGSIESSAFITTGGTSSQFVKGNGSLDSTSYQPAGAYITALTGDGTASGPGSAVLTLASVNANPGTYGDSITVPRVTVNDKGLVTNITPVAISLPAGSIVLVGDVSAVGSTGTNITATLATVNSNVYGSNTFLKFAVNAKGLVTSASPVTSGDVIGLLGYTPVPDSRSLTINGLTKDLTADRTWNVGTVTSVQVSVPPAFTVTTAPITSFGTMNIAATGNTSQYIRGDGSLAAFPAIPTTSGTSGTSGSSGSSGVSSTDTNIYNSDGTLTGNRVVTLNANQLVYRTNASTLQNYTYSVGTPTGVTASAWPSSVIYEAEYLMNSLSSAEPFNSRLWARNQTASTRSFWVNQVYVDITAESTGATNIYNQSFVTSRGSQLDTATAAAFYIRGISSTVGHRYTGSQATTTQINTTNVVALVGSTVNYVGNMTNVYNIYSQLGLSNGAQSQNSTITNYYAFYSDATLGRASGGTATITNYYGLHLTTPTVNATGTITNRWGIYAPDSAMNHYINGNVVIGSNTLAGYKFDVNGTARIQGTTIVNGDLGVNTTPNYTVHIINSGGSPTNIYATNTASGFNQSSRLTLAATGGTSVLEFNGTGVASAYYGISTQGMTRLYNTGASAILFDQASNASIAFATNGSLRGQWTGDGNFLINTTSNPGQKFYLNGSMRVDGQTSATAGGSASLYLIVNLDGTNYKIALLNT